ncbi:hypothetical protein [Ruminococcus albus]|uniref:DUF4179 domain-containing protein n=1 Tax=Ruminococcus albus TaxID=1264 RepID=A0A1I1NDP2_RUMAL|nr:hypothetical protein [Ruminococcus albus]SFC95749.1 hypothetical protein SAMN02910406_02739 [Ruminococcus albus]
MKKREEMIRDIHKRIDEYETEQRAKRTKVKKSFPALAAITATAVCLPIVAYAYELYHKESVQKYIGVSGEQVLMESGYSAPQSFSNDKATLTIDTMLYDGHSALAVVTIEAHDPAYTFPHDYGFIPEIVCDAEGNALEIDPEERTYDGKFLSGYGGMSMWKDSDLPSNQCRYEINFPNTEDWNGSTLYMRFAMPNETDYVFASKKAGRELLDGMIVAFDFTQNCECRTLTAENGEQIMLSDFELIRPSSFAPDTTDEKYVVNTAAKSSYKLVYTDGTEEDLQSVMSDYNSERSGNIFEFLASDVPCNDENATIIHKVSEIAAVEIDGIRYTR